MHRVNSHARGMNMNSARTKEHYINAVSSKEKFLCQTYSLQNINWLKFRSQLALPNKVSSKFGGSNIKKNFGESCFSRSLMKNKILFQGFLIAFCVLIK